MGLGMWNQRDWLGSYYSNKRDGGWNCDDGNIISEKWSALGYTVKVRANRIS